MQVVSAHLDCPFGMLQGLVRFGKAGRHPHHCASAESWAVYLGTGHEDLFSTRRRFLCMEFVEEGVLVVVLGERQVVHS